MTEETAARKPDIRLSQLIATALAAITAAFLGSRLGTAGTVIGAGVASIVSTVAGALYQHSLDRTSRSVRSRVGPARTDDPAAPDATDDTVSVPGRPAARRPRWIVAVALTALAFVIGMGAVTGVELLRNGPISGGDNGTTVGSLFGQPTRRAPSTSTPPSTTTSSTTTPSTTTTTAPPTTVPTTTPTTTTAPPTSTTAPTTTAPTTTTQP
ncbi:MAG TPA: hypothetical protein VGL06_05310 [Pseudonocardiaceae bacterium]